MRQILAVLFILFSYSFSFAGEQITGFEEKDVAVLNEELRKNSDEIGQSVKLSKDQTISGTKTFSSFPVTPSSAPTSDYEVANKKYVDDNAYVLADASVTTAKLKTASGEVSTGTENTFLTLPGGEYGFYPQIKGNGTTFVATFCGRGDDQRMDPGTTYASLICVTRVSSGGVFYAKQRYVTSSGTDFWLFVLVDKDTNKIVSSYAALDHPAYGNGGDFTIIPHPFKNYDNKKYDIYLIDKPGVSRIRSEVTPERSLLTILNEDYSVSGIDLTYEPLHSGKYIMESGSQVKVMVNQIPNYIKVRTLIKNGG